MLSQCLFNHRKVYKDLVNAGVIVVNDEKPPPPVPMDYSWARVSAMYIYYITHHHLCYEFIFLCYKVAVIKLIRMRINYYTLIVMHNVLIDFIIFRN